MILYGSSLSPFVRKVLVFAAEKGIELDVKSIGIGSEDQEFRAASPFGKIPALKDGDFTISDSSAIIAYLDALRPEPNLIPTEPRARARCVWFEEFADTLVMDCGRKLFFNRVVAPLFMGREGDLAAADRAEREQLPPLLDYLEGQVPNSLFLVEDRFTLADIAVASPLLNVIHHLDIAIEPARLPRLAAYVEAILARPSFAFWLAKERRLFERVRGAAANAPAAPASAPA
jgi:glutathione S-transferase